MEGRGLGEQDADMLDQLDILIHALDHPERASYSPGVYIGIYIKFITHY